MNLAKNKCSKKINQIKNNIDQSPDKIRYVREELQYLVDYIKKIKKQNPHFSKEDMQEFLFTNIKKSTRRMKSPTRSDMYLYKTLKYALKNLDLAFYKIDNMNRDKFINDTKKEYIYTSNIQKNLEILITDMLPIILEEIPTEFKNKFVQSTLNEQEKRELKVMIKKHLEIFYETYEKGIKEKYCIKLADIIKLLDEMDLLKKYNDKNNKIVEELNLSILKYEYEAQKSKFGITDLKNVEFLKRFSLEEIVAMTSFYSNRLAKEVINYNEALYIAKKIQMIDKIFEGRVYELKVTDEELREMIAQLGFLTEIAKDITHESAQKITKGRTRKNNTNKSNNELSIVDKSKFRKKAMEEYETDYNELYNNFFLTQFDNEFEEDLYLSTILEIDRHNLYKVKDFAMESLMVTLADKGKNKNMNWGYIPENKNGKNSIQNKEKFILIGMDMKGYNMPIKLHFEKNKLETFLRNYTKGTQIPVYEGDEDMEVIWNGYITTQVYSPLTKEQRKQLKEIKLDSSDYRYRFLEHIKWMMLPNRYPKYLCDHQGNKKAKRYVDIVSGIVTTDEELLEQ